MTINYHELFNFVYSTRIPESLKNEVIYTVELPIQENFEVPSYINECIQFLDSLAYSNMSEELANEMIDRVFEGCSEEFMEDIYKAYVQAKAIQYVCEDSAPIGLRALAREADTREQAQAKTEARKQAIGNAVNKVKGAANTARQVAKYTGHVAKEGIKNAVGKVKNWWNDYKAKAKAYDEGSRVVSQPKMEQPRQTEPPKVATSTIEKPQQVESTPKKTIDLKQREEAHNKRAWDKYNQGIADAQRREDLQKDKESRKKEVEALRDKAKNQVTVAPEKPGAKEESTEPSKPQSKTLKPRKNAKSKEVATSVTNQENTSSEDTSKPKNSRSSKSKKVIADVTNKENTQPEKAKVEVKVGANEKPQEVSTEKTTGSTSAKEVAQPKQEAKNETTGSTSAKEVTQPKSKDSEESAKSKDNEGEVSQSKSAKPKKSEGIKIVDKIKAAHAARNTAEKTNEKPSEEKTEKVQTAEKTNEKPSEEKSKEKPSESSSVKNDDLLTPEKIKAELSKIKDPFDRDMKAGELQAKYHKQQKALKKQQSSNSQEAAPPKKSENSSNPVKSENKLSPERQKRYDFLQQREKDLMKKIDDYKKFPDYGDAYDLKKLENNLADVRKSIKKDFG